MGPKDAMPTAAMGSLCSSQMRIVDKVVTGSVVGTTIRSMKLSGVFSAIAHTHVVPPPSMAANLGNVIVFKNSG